MTTSRAVRKPGKRAVSARLASLQRRRAGMARHVAALAAFPPAQLMPFERGQLRYFKEQLRMIDQLIVELTGA